MDTFIKKRVLIRTKSSAETRVVVSRAMANDMEEFYQDMDDIYDEPVWNLLPPEFYRPE